jgi:group II intron reverse transcriptase/maturase
MKPGNAGGGKGPQFESNARSSEAQGIGKPTNPGKLQDLQTALHTKAKGASTYRFYALYDKLYRADVLAEAYRRCRVNGGAPGVDGQRFDDIEEYGLEQWLGELAQELKEKKYRPEATRRVHIPKPNGKMRPLGIATIRDRVAMMAAVLILEPIFEADLQPEQYAYRAKRNALMAVKHVHSLLNTGHTHVVDADLSTYFDTLPHPELMKSVARRVCDRHMLHLIKMWLTAPIEEDDGKGGKRRSTPNKDQKRGTPQGSPISPLLSNLYMRRFILGWHRRGYAKRFSAQIVNYADDLVICCKGNAKEAMEAMRKTMEELKLTVNEEKTRVCQAPEEPFDFLGYTFGRCYSPKTGRAYIGTRPSKKKVQRMVEKISAATDRRTTHRDVRDLVRDLNDSLRGWANYFRLGPVSKEYRLLDAHTTNRLRRWLGRKHKVRRGSTRARFSKQFLHETLGLIELPKLTKSLPWAKV